jgi:hypothetical protein
MARTTRSEPVYRRHSPITVSENQLLLGASSLTEFVEIQRGSHKGYLHVSEMIFVFKTVRN